MYYKNKYKKYLTLICIFIIYFNISKLTDTEELQRCTNKIYEDVYATVNCSNSCCGKCSQF